MLQSLSNLVSGDSRALQILVVGLVFVVLLIILYGLFRLLFAHRLRAPGASRSRAPRLGVVDVFGLDGQRQLVIVRRDNTEHLLMIGGPNDLVIESQIVRGAANGAREAPKAPAEPQVEPAPAPTPPRPVAPTPLPARRNPLRATPPAAEAPPVVSAPPPEEVSAPDVAPEPPLPPEVRARVAPQRSDYAAPKPPAEPATPPAAKPVDVSPEIPAKPAVEAPPPRKPLMPPKPVPPGPRPALPSPITPLRPRSLVGPDPAAKPPAESLKPAAPDSAVAKIPDVIITPPPPADGTPPAAAPSPAEKPPRPRKDDTFYDLESLEAEMARLLGRDG